MVAAATVSLIMLYDEASLSIGATRSCLQLRDAVSVGSTLFYMLTLMLVSILSYSDMRWRFCSLGVCLLLHTTFIPLATNSDDLCKTRGDSIGNRRSRHAVGTGYVGPRRMRHSCVSNSLVSNRRSIRSSAFKERPVATFLREAFFTANPFFPAATYALLVQYVRRENDRRVVLPAGTFLIKQRNNTSRSVPASSRKQIEFNKRKRIGTRETRA